MSEKLQIKNTLFQLSVGLIAYFLFIKNTLAKPTKANLIVGDVIADGAPFTAKYFKDSEYFGSHAIPDKYVKNWWSLARVLDEIRHNFGSAVLITQGYSPGVGGVITNTFSLCLSAKIYPANNDQYGLLNIAKALQAAGKINVSEIIKTSGGETQITING